ncbi:MAG: hypothetical protein KDA89_22740, partial [Planctomycetaceae bacterium]|nr:hypothetical protein [Planctomycetaceae bacterium]
DHRTDTITFTGPNVEDSVIVHEATHALLDATHVGKSITKGSHETAAFLAETVYMLAGSRTGHSIEPRRIMAPLYRMARELLAFNESHSTGTYPCPDSDISFIRGTLRQFMNTERTDEMNGIPLELPGGLIRKMLLESRRSAGR